MERSILFLAALVGTGRVPNQGEESGDVCDFTQHRQGQKKSRYLNLDCVGKNSLGAE